MSSSPAQGSSPLKFLPFPSRKHVCQCAGSHGSLSCLLPPSLYLVDEGRSPFMDAGCALGTLILSSQLLGLRYSQREASITGVGAAV